MGNVNNHLICGRSNHLPLSQRGKEQSEFLAQRLQQENWQFDKIYCSVAERAKATAHIALDALGISQAELHYSDQLVEVSKGEWEGKVRAELYTPEIKAEMLANSYHFKSPGGESQEEVEDRMENWLRDSLSQLQQPSAEIAIFTHGFAIKSLFRRIMQSEPIMVYRTIIHNTSISSLQIDEKDWLVERMNDHQHLTHTDFVGHYW